MGKSHFEILLASMIGENYKTFASVFLA